MLRRVSQSRTKILTVEIPVEADDLMISDVCARTPGRATSQGCRWLCTQHSPLSSQFRPPATFARVASTLGPAYKELLHHF